MNTMRLKRLLPAVLLSGLAFASPDKADVEANVMMALAQELVLMTRPMNDFERRFMNVKKNSDALAENQFGDAFMKDEGRVPIEFVRAPTSLGLLNDAANLSKQAGEDNLRRIVNERALSRGDRMMTLGFDKTVGLFFRESLMRHAIEYYRIGEATQKQSYAENERSILGLEVQRAQGERKALIEEYQQKMQPMIDAMQRVDQVMQITEAEKRAFMEEADALEDELDF